MTNCEQDTNTSIKTKCGGSITIGETWSTGYTVGFDWGELSLGGSYSWSWSKSITWSQEIEIEVLPGQMICLALCLWSKAQIYLCTAFSATFPVFGLLLISIVNQSDRVHVSFTVRTMRCRMFSGRGDKRLHSS